MAREFNRLPLRSHQTAVCIVPPPPFCQEIDRLRRLHDKSFEKWPAHINLVYPFVAVDKLVEAIDMIRSRVLKHRSEPGYQDLRLHLEKSDHFSHRHSNTIFLSPVDDSRHYRLRSLRSTILEAFRQKDDDYHPHLTVGQCKAKNKQDKTSLNYLLSKASLLLPIEWQVEELVILIREKFGGPGDVSNRMRTWGTIQLADGAISRTDLSLNSPPPLRPVGELDRSASEGISTQSSAPKSTRTTNEEASGVTYQFSPEYGTWEPVNSPSLPAVTNCPERLTVSSYNVLAESSHPPSHERDAVLLGNILSDDAISDVLVLQEVSDSFLSHLLGNNLVRESYPFTSHAPSDQPGSGPLPSLRNIVMLSRHEFKWEWLPFEQHHKGAVIAQLCKNSISERGSLLPVVVAAIHLTSGLSDMAVAAKVSQLRSLLNRLTQKFQDHPWVIAGDFNIATSSQSISETMRSKQISSKTVSTLSSFETFFMESGLNDSWIKARAGIQENLCYPGRQIYVEELFEGEEGATFDPLENLLAAESVARGVNKRPQRYDRILYSGEDLLEVECFNMFGFPKGISSGSALPKTITPTIQPSSGSDHWGIRAKFRLYRTPTKPSNQIQSTHLASLKARKPSLDLSVFALEKCLTENAMIPSHEEASKRSEAFECLKNILQELPSRRTGKAPEASQTKISLVVTPVGSYGLDMWTSSSDIDCLAVGSLNSDTFFELAEKRLRCAVGSGVKVLRLVDAASGTMLELAIRGIKLDLQYCPGTKLVERWPEVTQLSLSDPLFQLPLLSLSKLKPFREMEYLKLKMPDMATFRTVYRFLKLWASQRGIYSSKLGYLGGIHITLMLFRVCKLLSSWPEMPTAADVLCTFFSYYAQFDWAVDMVLDPFSHPQKPRYQRSVREPMVILGLFPPIINVARAVTVPTLETMLMEFRRAEELLSKTGVKWQEFISGTHNPSETIMAGFAGSEFLNSFSSYVRINVQYWTLSPENASTLIGWLESRLALLLVEINRRMPDLHARLWPARFASAAVERSETTDFEACYLIGLARKDKKETNETTYRLDRKTAQATLQGCLDRFTEQIRGDEKYYDASTSWIDVTRVRQSDLGNLDLDDREWIDYTTEDYKEELEAHAGGTRQQLPSLATQRTLSL